VLFLAFVAARIKRREHPKMNNLLVKVTIAWIVGYALAIKLGPVPAAGRWLLPSALAVLIAAIFVRQAAREVQGRRRLALLVLILLTACLYYGWNEDRNRTKLPAAVSGSETAAMEVAGTLLTPVDVDGDRATFVLRTRTISVASAAPLSVRERLRVTVRLIRQQEQAVAASWQRGDKLRLTGKLIRPEPARNYGGFDYRAYLRRQHIHCLLSAKGTDGIERESAAASLSLLALQRKLDGLRSLLAAKLASAFPPEQAGYMNGLVLGITDGIDPEQYDQFSGLGLTHLLAISGLHVAVFTGALLWLSGRLRIPRETAIRLVLLLLPLYVLLTGAAASIVRAGLMAGLGLLAVLLGRRKDALSLVCLAALLMLVRNPYYALDVGFQLSFLVTAGLIVGVTPLSRLLPIRQPQLNGAVSVALTAQLVSFPLTVYYFNQLSFLSLPANLLLVSLVSFVVTPGGTLAMLAALVHPGTAQLLAWPVVVLNRVTFGIVSAMNAVPGMRLIYPSPPGWWIPLYYACGGLLLAAAVRAKEARRLRQTGVMLPEGFGSVRSPFLRLSAAGGRNAAAGLFVVLLVGGCVPSDRWQSAAGSVSFLDVGQGDSILIRTPEGRTLLIDGGGTVNFRKPGESWKDRRDPYEVGEKLLVPLLKKRGIRSLDTLIISHLDEDHIGGLQAVLEEFPVHRVLFNGTLKKSDSAERLLRTALHQGAAVEAALRPSRYQPDGETELTFLGPAAAAGVLTVEPDQNDRSLVFLLDMLGHRFLFPGDAGQEAERELLAQLPELPDGRPVEVLKVGHHGSSTSTTADWLAFWQPEHAVISVGKNNRYGHPSAALLARLSTAGANVDRTDLSGEIRIQVSREGLRIERKLAGADGT
jgi:competence protein ComEC